MHYCGAMRGTLVGVSLVTHLPRAVLVRRKDPKPTPARCTFRAQKHRIGRSDPFGVIVSNATPCITWICNWALRLDLQQHCNYERLRKRWVEAR